jgi:CheY-like chemotaxis protein
MISPTVNSSKSNSQKRALSATAWKTAKKAWDILQQNPEAYKLLIVDLDMPEMSGLELCQKVREKGWEVPMISLTSDDSREKDLLAAGFSHVLIKPLLDNSYFGCDQSLPLR